MDEITILRAITSTECCSFNEFCSGLGDSKPEKGNGSEWHLLFKQLEKLEAEGLIEVERVGERSIDTLILTEAGAARVRAARSRF